MTTWFISRHPGATQWMRQRARHFDRHLPHLDDPALIQPGDTVIGTLPVNLAAQVCARGAAYWHLSLHLPASAHGRELNAQELHGFNATLEQYSVTRQATS